MAYILAGNSSDLQEGNRSLILRRLRDVKSCSRSQLAKQTGLTSAAITNITAAMLSQGIIVETGVLIGEKGRRAYGIELNSGYCTVIGVKVARRSFGIVAMRWTGEILQENSYELDIKKGAAEAMKLIQNRIKEMLLIYTDTLAIGFAVPGPFLKKEGRIALMSGFEGWGEINFVDEMKKTFDLPICVEHDANCSAFAEWLNISLDKNENTLLNLLFNEGVGAGVIQNGQLFDGYDGTAAEVGHISINMEGKKCICGNRGCLELYSSSVAFPRWVAEELKNQTEISVYPTMDLENLSAGDIFKMAKKGEPFYIEAVKKVGYYIGCGIANSIYAFDPNLIVISGIMTEGGDLLLESIKQTVQERVLPSIYRDLEIRFSAITADPIMVGAGLLAGELLLNEPKILFAKGE